MRNALVSLLGVWVLGLPLTGQAQVFDLPSFKQVKAGHTPSNAWLLDRQGQVVHTQRMDFSVQRAPWVELKDIAPPLVLAVIAAEDQRFESHAGVDWQALASATWNNAWALLGQQRARGASTLSMQLVSLLDEQGKKAGQRGVLDKVSQAARALSLERSWSKEQILEAYLNRVSFRGELVGVGALSQGLFSKSPSGLSTEESAIAAVMLRAPNAPPALLARRACTLLKIPAGSADCVQVSGLVEYLVGRPPTESSQWLFGPQGGSPQLSAHLAQKLLTKPGQTLRSSLSLPLQTVARRALQGQLAQLMHQRVEDGAVLVLDNATGEVLAWVGSSGELSQAAQVDGVSALRQAGSTLKPFLYGLAIERGYLTAASLIEDAPYALDTGNGLYAPQNYEAGYKGWVTVRAALGNSLNIPAVKTLAQTGLDPFYHTLQRLGFSSLRQLPDWYGYSLALGSADVSLAMLTNAYRALANGGVWSPLHLEPQSAAPPAGFASKSTEASERRRALSEPVSFIVSDILSDRRARVLTFGMESWLGTPYWTAVKTGTSKDMRDNWCIGYSRRYTVGVWVGNASGQPMQDVSGVTGAAPVWREVMDWLHLGSPEQGRKPVRSMPPSAPTQLVQQTVRFEPAIEPKRPEWFIRGSERELVQLGSASSLPKIRYPAQGTVIALDADIPPHRQRIRFSTAGGPAEARHWRLNDKPLPAQAHQLGWLPLPGQHRLQLLNQQGKVLDEVRFSVRPLRQPG